MQAHRVVFLSTVSVLLVITFLSGPFVHDIDFSDNRQGPAIENRLQITDAQFPEQATISPGRFGTDQMVIRLGSTTITIGEISGQPIVNYKLRISGLRYVRTAIHQLSENRGSRSIRLGFDPDRIPAGRINQAKYRGEVEIVIRDTNGLSIAARTNITVTVRNS